MLSKSNGLTSLTFAGQHRFQGIYCRLPGATILQASYAARQSSCTITQFCMMNTPMLL